MNNFNASMRVLLSCSGTGWVNRGIEVFFREAFDGLRITDGLRMRLLKGAGLDTPDERVCWALPRTASLAKTVGVLMGRNGYVVEQWSSFPSVAAQIREFRPHVVFYGDANLGFLLFRLRNWIGVPYALLFSNGGPVHPPFVRTDFVHHVTPVHYQEALDAGEPASKHFMVPYGIRAVPAPTLRTAEECAELRRKLRLPLHRPIVLSVGWIRRFHKRMHYVIAEVAQLPSPRPYLQLLGCMDEGSREILDLGKRLLGPEGFGVRSVPCEEVFEYYRASDCFVLASLHEGFGRVYLEALLHGLPVIAHDGPVTRYVLGSHGILGDLSRAGTLAGLIREHIAKPPDLLLMRRRWAAVRDHFSWPMLAGRYLEMFQACSGRMAGEGRALATRSRISGGEATPVQGTAVSDRVQP